MNQQLDQTALLALVQQMQQQLSDQQNQLLALHASHQNQPVPRFHLPDPPRFDGKPFMLRTWLPSIQAKLDADGLTGRQAFDYVYNRLEPSQQASVLHLRESSSSPDQIFQYFQRLCYNPREKQESTLRFANIRQKDDESLIAYLARFERLAHEAGVKIQDPIQSIFATTTLHRGLRRSLREILEQASDSLFSLSYEEYLEFLQRFERRQPRPQNHNYPRNQTQNQTPFRPPFKPQTRTQPEPDLMDTSVNRVQLRSSTPTSSDATKIKSNLVRLSSPL
jgi:hypothetical protein